MAKHKISQKRNVHEKISEIFRNGWKWLGNSKTYVSNLFSHSLSASECQRNANKRKPNFTVVLQNFANKCAYTRITHSDIHMYTCDC